MYAKHKKRLGNLYPNLLFHIMTNQGQYLAIKSMPNNCIHYMYFNVLCVSPQATNSS